MFIIALKVSAPVMVALILTSVAMGLIARTVPQMHIFIVAIPLKIFIGLVFLGLTLPFFVHYLVQLLQNMGADIWQLITLCRPGG
jgi:flagellar biosynthetic protein FliR